MLSTDRNYPHMTLQKNTDFFKFQASTVAVSILLSILLLCDGSGDSFTAGILILLMTGLNLAITGLDGYLREQEIFKRTDR